MDQIHSQDFTQLRTSKYGLNRNVTTPTMDLDAAKCSEYDDTEYYNNCP